MPIGLVDGIAVRDHLPWLRLAYEQVFLRIGETAVGRRLRVSPDMRTTININVLRQGMQYERHVDTNHLTGLLFASTLPPGAGGELIFETKPHAQCIRPRAGRLLFFDARSVIHYVARLVWPNTRLSACMNYYYSDEPIERPADLDSYLYGQQQ